ncbi:uncharacterized protein LOC135489584 isoform X2 [Lineus longissimus]|uniref:uncharacterized protein LOC135489584 isoform X2 n=1 Tax=Lineus longissimus TaxID=88925 RepID=UPI00315D00CE
MHIVLHHAATLENIHNFFCQLDARICRAKLTRSGCRTTFSNVRLVQGQCNKDRSVEEGAMMQQVQERANLDKLEDEDFQLYRDAILCAYFPKLCAPDPPPTPHTPSPGPRHLFTFTISEETPNLHEELPLATNDDEDTSTLIQAETLCDILRKAFRLSEERARQYDRVAFSRYAKKGQPKILAEELVSQLSVLETNKHPYYNPKAFVSRYAYDQWQQWERQHITQLLAKFWHYSLPPPVTLHTESLKGKHEQYKLLMKKLLGYERIYQTARNNLSGPRTPLSSASRRLLKEFGLRYGVGEMYRKLVYLEYLTENFMNEPWFTQHIISHMMAISDMLPSCRGRIIMTEDELQLLSTCSGWLHGQCENSLTRVKRLFPGNRPPEGVASLIQLLHKVLELKAYLSGEDQKPIKDYLMQFSFQGFRTAYERHKMLASHELMINAFDNSLCPELLNMVLARIMDEVTDYKNNYGPSFERYFDIAQEAAVEFYKLLMGDVEILCEDVLKNVDPNCINHLLLSLAYNLHQLDKDWAEYIPLESQTWHLTFLPQSLLWLRALKGHMQSLVIEAVSKDKFTIVILPPDADLSPKPSVMTPQPRQRSSSQHSLSHSANSAFSSPSTRMPSSVSSLARESETAVIQESRESHVSSPDPDSSHQSQHGVSNAQKRESPIMRMTNKLISGFKFSQNRPENQVIEDSTHSSNDSVKSQDIVDGSRAGNFLQFSRGHTLTHSVSTPDLQKQGCMSDRRGSAILHIHSEQDLYRRSSTARDKTDQEGGRDNFLSTSCPLNAFSEHGSNSTISYNEEEEELLRQHRQFWLHYKDMKSPRKFLDEAEGQKLSHQLVALLGKRTESSDFEAFGELASQKLLKDSAMGLDQQEKVSNANGVSEGGLDTQQGGAHAQLLNHGHSWSSEQSLPVQTGDASQVVEGIRGAPRRIRMNHFEDALSSSDEEDADEIDPDRDFQFFEDVFKVSKMSSLHKSVPNVSGNIVYPADVPGIGVQKKAASTSAVGFKIHTPKADRNGNVGQGHHGSGIAHINDNIDYSNTANISQVTSIDASVGHLKPNSKIHPAVSGLTPNGNQSNRNRSNTAERQDSVHRLNMTQLTPQNGVQGFLELFNENGLSSVLTSDLLLPISSSFLDTFIAIHRYIRFGRSLFEVLLPLPKSLSLKRDQLGPFFSEIMAGREKIYEKFVKGLCNALSVYADNIMCLDLCAVPVEMSNCILGKEMTGHLCSQQDSGLIWGCRHIIENVTNCFMYIDCKAKYLADRFEPVTQEMCCRVNILSTILKLLPKFKSQMTEIASLETMKKLVATTTRCVSSTSQLTESMRDYEYISSYSTPVSHASRSNLTATPSEHGLAETSSSILEGEETIKCCHEHVQILMKGQLKLLAFRINLFLKEALSLLLSLNMGNKRVAERLQPVSDFLGNYIKQLKRWLYSDLYKLMVEDMWVYIVEDFNDEVKKLIHWKDNTKTKAELLLQAVSFFMKFLSTRCQNLSLDMMMEKMDRVVFLLQLYTQPSERLIALYYQLYEACNQSESSSEDDDHLPSRYLQQMKHDLHLLRKCFSGEDIINWIMKHPHSPATASDPLSGCESEGSSEMFARETAENVCQKLLDDQIIVGVDGDHHALGFFHSTGAASDIDVSYPRMTRVPANEGMGPTPGSHDFEDPDHTIDQPWNDGHERHGVWTPFFYGQGLNRPQAEQPIMEDVEEKASNDGTLHTDSTRSGSDSLQVLCGSLILDQPAHDTNAVRHSNNPAKQNRDRNHKMRVEHNEPAMQANLSENKLSPNIVETGVNESHSGLSEVSVSNDHVEESSPALIAGEVEGEATDSNESPLSGLAGSESVDVGARIEQASEQTLKNGAMPDGEANKDCTEATAVENLSEKKPDSQTSENDDSVIQESRQIAEDQNRQMPDDTVSCSEELEGIWQNSRQDSPPTWVDEKIYYQKGDCLNATDKPPKGSGDMLSDSESSTPKNSSRGSSDLDRWPESQNNDCGNLAGSYRSASAFGPFAPRYLDSSTVVSSSIFQSCRNNLYRFKSIQDIGSSTHNLTESVLQDLTDHNHSHNNMSKLTGTLLQSAIDKEVTTNFLLTILYTRRKYDKTTKKFFSRVPVEMITDIKTLEESDVNGGCFG